MKRKYFLDIYKLIDGGRMIILMESDNNGFLNHRWVFSKEDSEIFE